MTVEVLFGRLDAAERAQVAVLHHDMLEGSILSLLGRTVVEKYYAHIDRSPLEDIVACASGGRILGAAVVSFAPATMQTRFFRAAPLTILTACGTRMFQSRHVRRFFLSKFARRSHPDASTGDVPELVQLFVAAKQRGGGLGRRLVAGVDKMVKLRGFEAYVAKTEDVAENLAIRFYQKTGFEPAHRHWLDGKNYLYFERKLT